MTKRFPLKALAAALLLLAAVPVAARADDLEDCRGTAKMPIEARVKACTAVIDGKQVTGPDLATAYYRRAIVAASDPRADPAAVMADVSKAIEINPKLMEAYAFRSMGYSRGQQYDKAIADLTTAIGLAPDRWGLYSLRAMVELQKKDIKASIADFKAALALNPPKTSADMIRQRLDKLEKASQ